MATEYKIENRNLYIYLDGELDHPLAKKIKYQYMMKKSKAEQ